MYVRKFEQGQSIVLLTVVILGLLAIMALSIDGGSIYTQRRQAQTAADAAAFSAAYAMAQGGDPVAAGRNQAALNGITHNGTDPIVTVNHPPVSGEYKGKTNYVQVLITSSSKPVFSSFIFKGSLSNTVEAVARYGADAASIESLIGDAALVSLCPICPKTMVLSGDMTLDIQGGGAFVNSDDDAAFYATGNMTVSTDEGIKLHGGGYVKGNATINSDVTARTTLTKVGGVVVNGTLTEHADVPAFSYPPPALVVEAPAQTAPTCSANGSLSTSGDTATMTPGKYSKTTLNGTYTKVVMQPGSYCFSGDFTLNGSFTVTADGVKLNMGSKGLYIKGDTKFNAKGSLIYLSSGTLTLDGKVQLSIPNSVIYMGSGNFIVNANNTISMVSDKPAMVYMGSGSMSITGSSSFTSTNTVYYLNSGSVKWNGNTQMNMSAPTSGDYKGLLLYLPYTTDGTVTINGNANSSFTGSIMNIGGYIYINGTSDTSAIHSRVVGFKINVSGNSDTTIVFNPNENYSSGGEDSTTIELVK